ncbi:MAG: GAF domain-containing protein, partial [Anaerolineales bacterium]|nr:GAF domain-containing protein [Anaerolineales bacterium]
MDTKLTQTKVTFQRTGSIRTRLLWAFILLVLLPVTILSLVLVLSNAQGNRLQLEEKLGTVLTYKIIAIEDWLSHLKAEAADTAIGLDALSVASTGNQETSTPTEPESREVAEEPVAQSWEEQIRDMQGAYLQQLAQQSEYVDEWILLDLNGIVQLASGSTVVGRNLAGEAFFLPDIEDTTVPAPVYSSELGYVSFFVVQPIFSADGEKDGLLVGRADKMLLNQILLEEQGLGETGETFLVGSDYEFLSTPRYPVDTNINRSTAAMAAVMGQEDGSSTYTSYRGVTVFGVYRWLPQLEAGLIAEQELLESVRASYAVMAVNLSVGIASLLIAMVAALVITSDIATPVSELAETAAQVTRGNLFLEVETERSDEIGALAESFNSMTAQLRQTLGGLEQQVADRTSALEQRTAYLQASAEVSQAVNTIMEPDQLVQQVVNLIHDRFGLYYVGLFQVDESGEWAVLRAGTGEAGKAMIARSHRIRVGVGMIGWTVINARPRIALEAAQDQVRLRSAELPDTRSEAALPLRSRGKVIGALSIQSTLSGAFNEDNIAVFQVMADQVAVAIDNARLYVETQQALEDLRRFYTEQSLEIWRDTLQRKGNLRILSNQLGITVTDAEWKDDTVDAFWSGEVVKSASA